MSEKESKESQYIVSHPGLSSDPLFRLDWDPSVTLSNVGLHFINCVVDPKNFGPN